MRTYINYCGKSNSGKSTALGKVIKNYEIATMKLNTKRKAGQRKGVWIIGLFLKLISNTLLFQHTVMT